MIYKVLYAWMAVQTPLIVAYVAAGIAESMGVAGAAEAMNLTAIAGTVVIMAMFFAGLAYAIRWAFRLSNV